MKQSHSEAHGKKFKACSTRSLINPLLANTTTPPAPARRLTFPISHPLSPGGRPITTHHDL
jgi:hypothetical protein